MSDIQVKRVPWEVVEKSELNGLPVVKMVGEKEWDAERKVNHFPHFHVINKEGFLVCKCAVLPHGHEVWDLDKLEPQYRWTICNASRRYLRQWYTTQLDKPTEG